MNEAGPKIKQQIIDKIKSSTNILVTVSKNPTVDELAAAIGLTTILNKLGKHGTAIFSGEIPPAINFLEPDKVFENTADSLRDFIIALDKEKADHLRYKVEGDVVKIFITPYRTTITGDDLEFSQGDYNIELVLALGVANQEHLDTALSAHGQVLHDVTIATFSAGKQSSQLGSMDWRDSGASSLSEMVANISELLKVDKPVLDKQISTALLTGIVSATDRFSNLFTTSRVMTTAAQLMASGADQQLIAARLKESHEIEKLDKIPVVQKIKKPVEPVIVTPVVEEVLSSTLPDGSLVIDHDMKVEVEKKLDNIVAASNVSTLPSELLIDTPTVQPEPSVPLTPPVPQNQPTQPVKPVQPVQPVQSTQPAPAPKQVQKPVLENVSTLVSPKVEVAPEAPKVTDKQLPTAVEEPMLGGTLSATVDQASDDRQREEREAQNKTILTHSYLGDANLNNKNPINGIGQIEPEPVDIFADSMASSPGMDLFQNSNSAEQQPQYEHPPIGIPADAEPMVQPPILDLPLPPQLPDFSTLPNMTPSSLDYNDPALMQQPNFSTLPPQQATSNDPGQFVIPGQQ